MVKNGLLEIRAANDEVHKLLGCLHLLRLPPCFSERHVLIDTAREEQWWREG